MRNYRDLRVWQEAHRLTLSIYRETGIFPVQERYGLTSQMLRASASIAANLAEGCGRRSERELVRFAQIAMGSASELDYELLLARDLGLLTIEQHQTLEASLLSVRKMLSACVNSIQCEHADRVLA